ncbi:glucan 1,4-alpha-glucosidase [Chloroflexus sp.]|uniref:glucan 1,4-alpha-glucosidase n=1 Tax=Chloroflexus sp. TaxID=1904827 RepID=UPI00298F2609|nr:glucan 1,4-alpha-glucosidase [Chloroflexus sp.]MDW8402979.1 glucan 1,4-alpha-glucosidase [Chloroflexus sp.]
MTQASDTFYAPGWPGIPARWTSSAKTGVGTALSSASRVWFTLSHGILNEIYYPRIDTACIRDLGCIITDGVAFFSEEKRHTTSTVSLLAEGVPAYHLTNTCHEGRYQIEKWIVADPLRDVVLQQIQFTARQGTLDQYALYILLAPHLGNRGAGNTAWIADYKGVPMLFAERAGLALAVACSAPWTSSSAGFVGFSDGWQDLSRHYRLTQTYQRAENGNVALTAGVDLVACQGRFTVAIGFGQTSAEAALNARASLAEPFETVCAAYCQAWQAWQQSLNLPNPTSAQQRISAMVLRAHEAKHFPGGIIASLSIPWGMAKGDDDLGGYHLVWPRDLVEAAGGLLAIGAHDDARRVLDYLAATQEADGHWPQNMWLDGTPYWNGIQMDETAFPILLVDLATRAGALEGTTVQRYWPMVRRAAGFLVRNGPVTAQDRWEEDAGYSPFTLAVEIVALLIAADLAEQQDEPALAVYLRETADSWNADIDRWCYVTDTDLARQIGVSGYYVRIAPPDVAEAASPLNGYVPIKNRPPDQASAPAIHIVSPDALALVRFGLRDPHDPRITNTIRVIDALLKVDTPAGSVWRRYTGDGYGEHSDGTPFDGAGTGRGWPLLTGERAHYELAAGSISETQRLLNALERFANQGGFIPEQVWDSPDLPERELFFGRPSGSAMPLVWAHAEHLKLCRSLRDGKLFDLPPQPVARYLSQQVRSGLAIWRLNQKRRTMPSGAILRIDVTAMATIHWSSNGWQTTFDLLTKPSGLGTFFADLPTTTLDPGAVIVFTLFWNDEQRWEGRDYEVRVVAAELAVGD